MATKEPPFTVISEDGNFQIRDYSSLVAADVTVDGSRDEASREGFRRLAGYIFGGNKSKSKIAMTAPVVQSTAGSEKIAMTAPVLQWQSGTKWVVRFIMPEGSRLDGMPVPDDARVKLVETGPKRFAVVRFAGLANEPDVAKHTADLLDFVAANDLESLGPPQLARYNPPWTLWFLRRNEVMLELAA
jgi:SOUL heme-binding protein